MRQIRTSIISKVYSSLCDDRSLALHVHFTVICGRFYISLRLTIHTAATHTGPHILIPEYRNMVISDADLKHLERCVVLAEQALTTNDDPFGSVLVDEDGNVLQEDRNRIISNKDPTYHPELKLAQWAATNVDSHKLAGLTIYTSGEHCPMCSSAHAWCGLDRIVYVSSSKQLKDWMGELGKSNPVESLAINDIAPAIQVEGPVKGLDQRVRALHFKKAGKTLG